MISQSARSCITKRKDYIPGKPVEEVQRELGLTDIIKMASNENPLGTSPAAVKAMIHEVETQSNRYPESLCTELAIKLSKRMGIKQSELYLDNGGDAVITMIGLTYINPEDEVIFSELTFPAYENITTKMGGKCVVVPLDKDEGLDLEGFAKAVTKNTKMMFVCNPNNPTGKFSPKSNLMKLLDAVPSNVVVVVDEAYYEFADEKEYPQTLEVLDKYHNLIIVRTFSKIMGLAGLRVGYAIASEDVIKVLLKAREPFPVNRIAQAGALAALDDKEFFDKTLEINADGRLQYYTAFDEMGLKYYKTQTNFIYVDIRTDANEVFQKMLHDGVIVRPLNSQGRPNAMRITIGLKEENERTIASLKKALA